MPHPLTVAISDLHLARSTSRVQDGRDLLGLVGKADRVIINGDGVDYSWMSPERAEGLQRRTVEILEEKGREVVWIRGNHDVPVESAHDWLLENGVLYTHGHVFDFDLSRFTDPERAFAHVNEASARKHSSGRKDRWPLHVGDQLIQCVPARTLRRYHHRSRVFQGLRQLRRLLAPCGPIRQVVMGHSHIPGVRLCDGMPVFNTGAWTRNSRPFVHARRNGEQRLDPAPVRTPACYLLPAWIENRGNGAPADPARRTNGSGS